LQRLLPELLEICIKGQCTDSGGGGTKFALAKALDERHISAQNYLVTTCALHNLQTCLRNAVVNVLGEGGMNDKGEPLMNVMQMLHGAYNLQNWQEDEELKQLWAYLSEAADEKFKKLEEPIMTRWWLVGACACSFKECIITWRKICKAIRNSAPSGSASSKISSCTLNLIDSPVIINDLHLICLFHREFLFTHFKFLQLADARASKTPSFQARLLLVRYFLMVSDLKEIKEEWRRKNECNDYKTSLEQLSEIEQTSQQKKFTHFFRYVSESLTIHFRQWTSHLLFLGLFSNQSTATAIARLMSGLGIRNVENTEIYDEDQKRIIKLREFSLFLNRECNYETLTQHRNLPVVQENSRAIALIANGGDIWSDDACDILTSFRNIYLYQYSSLPTNTQFTERGVKESGVVSLGRRSETNRSILSISRGKLIPEALKKGREEIDGKQLQGKKRIKVLMRELLVHQSLIQNRRERNHDDFETEQKSIKKAITNKNCQFKARRIQCKVEKVIEKAHTNAAPNVYERRTGQTLTPLMDGKIQYHKMKKAHNLEAVRNELRERGCAFDQLSNWTALLKILKTHEHNPKFFTPRTDYDAFKWNSTHFGDEGEVI